MANRKGSFNHPRRVPSRFRPSHVVAVILVITVVFLLLERLKNSYHDENTVRPPPETARQQQKTPPDYEFKIYTSYAAPPTAKGTVFPMAATGTLAIIVDDMGSSLQEARELLAINVPITFAIIPGLPRVKAVAEAATAAGNMVIVHIPMEPQGYPRQRLEENGLLVAYPAEEITTRTRSLLAAVPGAVGANNHMGSRFTEQEEKMLPTLQVVKEKGLFYIDSRTSPQSIGYELAGRLGIKAATRNVFLDNQQDVAAILKQLHVAAELARRRGGVIAICHPHPTTIKALQQGIPELRKAGIKFVAAGELVR